MNEQNNLMNYIRINVKMVMASDTNARRLGIEDKVLKDKENPASHWPAMLFYYLHILRHRR